MPLISVVGRKSAAVRLLTAAIYALLVIGAVTMVYPFLVMISGSFKSDVDKNDFDLFPAFVHDDAVLYRKHMECKYNNDASSYNQANRIKAFEFRRLDPPPAPPPRLIDDWRKFEAAAAVPDSMYTLGWMQHLGDRLRLWKQREFRQRLIDLCGGDIAVFNQRFESQDDSWISVGSVVERITERRYQLTGGPLEEEFYRFKAEQAAWFRIYPSLDGKFVQGTLEPVYGTDVKATYNAAHGTSHESFGQVTLSRTAPAPPPARKEWEAFVRGELNLQYIRVADAAKPLFAEFLRKRYSDKLDVLNERYRKEYASFEQVPYPDDVIHADDRLVDWAEFVKTVPVEHLSLTGPEFLWRDFLRTEYAGDLAAASAAHATAYVSFETIPLPNRQVDFADFQAHTGELRGEFLSSNYRQVVDYIVLHGRSMWNTVIYCALAILLSLTVDPLAAYALSRFKLPSAYKILLFCMATMAFPAAVTMIPNFLLLKQLGLLNTYAALVLPSMANGFSIFLLKGFFDSLPRELYESAALDGAGEWTMFWNLTMSLSKPILAVLALNAFTAAYGNYMLAFILCPDPEMWTLMVFLYQLQATDGHMALTFAALLVAAVPTFLVFVFCQNIIIRGIVVPVEK